MIRQRSLTVRLTALFALASTTVLVGLGLLIMSTVAKHFTDQDEQLLEKELELIRMVVNERGAGAITSTFGEALHNHPGFFVHISAANGQPMYSTLADATRPILAAAKRIAGNHSFSVDAGEHKQFQAIKAHLKDDKSGEQLEVIVAVDTEIHDHFMRNFKTTLILYVAGSALIVVLLSWWAARRGLAPLRAMSDKVQAVSSHNFGERMPIETLPVEIADLAAKLNAMLERLQQDFHRITNFSTDIAHELRTPITNLLTQTDVVLTQQRTNEAYRDTLSSNAEELQRLARTISDMLFLAQTENGISLPSYEPLQLQEEITELFDFYDALAEEKGVQLQLAGDATIRGDRLMVRRALSNLISNAMRYTPAAGSITVSIAWSEGDVLVAVENDGPEIPAEHLPHLFDRFYRADKSRTKVDTDSAGLGLSITQAIMRAHQGDVTVRSVQRKTRFTLRFPHMVI
ncbi:MAG: heavy metal sensor histidine kinase [Herbaspirillum sp.]|jgi:two-component system heavy metal sensor histidine kinase CusS|uniref:heavy metal sensor histidine kinase n=1 Tax=unclassified Herbaspirillum TaxID=2624150 RepID=UPI0009823787|nr:MULTISPECIES: heavy metal sensor histidine kinase [unclassified Herbaspirillum]MCP3656715.1 heavy metal sensor histidine kinase [Herbaspirillum sp.]MCP3950469.1 heavy metal sensor histidine kinase [Herbaspirillum sp.]MCP4031003.1 heavy metal sensor histidine kinase [Herbaspirillum sp.]ONN67856.1 two-component sensor histidine kinase [Herbaspirillum sp. VT-16-41]